MYLKPKRKKIVYTNPADKLKAVERIVQNGESTRTISEELAVSLTSVQTWVKQYKDYGPAYFIDKEKAVKGEAGVWIDTNEYENLRQLEKNYEEMQLQVEILKKFQAFLKMK